MKDIPKAYSGSMPYRRHLYGRNARQRIAIELVIEPQTMIFLHHSLSDPMHAERSFLHFVIESPPKYLH